MKGVKPILVMGVCLVLLLLGIAAVGRNKPTEAGKPVEASYTRAHRQAPTGYRIDGQKDPPQTVTGPAFAMGSFEVGEQTLTLQKIDGQTWRYTDEKHNLYTYDALTGQLTGYSSGWDEWRAQIEDQYTKEQMPEIALQYLSTVFGEEVRQYELTAVQINSDLSYTVTYTRVIGGYETTEDCRARIDKSGYLLELTSYDNEVFGALDPARVEAVSREDLFSYAEAELAREYPMDKIDVEQTGEPSIVLLNGRYYFSIWYTITLHSGEFHSAADGLLPYDDYMYGPGGYEVVYYEIP